METIQLTILNPTGLHARPAREFVDIAKQYKSKLKISHGEKTVNGKSLISLLTLGVGHGGEVSLSADGDDALSLLEALSTAVATGLGEDLDEMHASSVITEPAVEVETPAGHGVPASPGLAIGPVWQARQVQVQLEETFSSVAEENERLAQAIKRTNSELTALIGQLQEQGRDVQAAIFTAHQEILNDPTLANATAENIAAGAPAGQAWQKATAAATHELTQLGSEVLAGRAADIEDVGQRVLSQLGGGSQVSQRPDYPVIVLAEDLAPSQTATFTTETVLAICTAKGGPTAHTAIIARSLGIPAIVGLGDSLLEIADGTQIIANGTTGQLIIDPDEAQLTTADKQRQAWQTAKEDNLRRAADAAITTDGAVIEVVTNVGSLQDAEAGARFGAEGVGLLRTEFLFLNRQTPPTEAEQVTIYSDIAAALPDSPIIIRTLDIGGDKPLPYIDQPAEENPFLGIRGIRLLLQRPELFKTQLRAILKANQHGHLKIMFPMVADLNELRQARKIVNEVRKELNAGPIDVGIMIEVPSAALCADQFAPEVDFFSVGTNDLTQYTLAMDRQHPELAPLSDGLHPAVLRLIAQTAKAAKAHDKWVGVCGELASDPLGATILIGLGVTELSVSPPAVPNIKAQIRQTSLSAAKTLAETALNCATAKEVRALGKSEVAFE